MNLNDLVKNAQPSLILDGMDLIKKNNLNVGCFVPDTNRLKLNSETAIEDHIKGRNIIDLDSFKEYFAASTLIHCFDGWMYLSHAISSLLKGDRGIAIHLAYYAELRAAISFLASQGILINSHIHINITSTGINKLDPSLGTHAAVWNILNAWISSNHINHMSILKYFKVNGFSLFDFVNSVSFPITPEIASLFTLDWISDWSLDVGNYQNDRKTRNIVSYQPQRLRDYPPINVTSKIDNIIKLWKFIEPNGQDKFSLLDKFAFKLLFERIFSYISDANPGLTLSALVDSTFNRRGLNPEATITHIIENNLSHPILDFARDATIQEPSGQPAPLTIISRALLMLRISTGAINELLSKSNISFENIGFYLQPIGIDNGYWKNHIPSNLKILWEDVSDSITTLEDLLNNSRPITFHELNSSYPEQLNKINQVNRAYLWSIAD